MTRDEAIERLNIHKSTNVFVDSIAEAIDMAIEALSAEAVQGFRGGKIPPKEMLDGTVLIPQHQWLEMERELAELKSEFGSATAGQGWISLSHDDDDLGTDFPYERDGEWVIVTDGNNISVERIKKDAYDHFYPNGRWFELEDVIAWMPLPMPYREKSEVEE